MSAVPHLIVGLGNPGSQYERTRHNVGAWFVEQLAEKLQATLRVESKFQARIAKVDIQGTACWLAIPTTFMNHSGQPLQALAAFYKIPSEAILVAHDELDFEAGTVRLKNGGGHGGHNGLRDIIQRLGNAGFWRLRIGIGHPGHRDGVTDYVLTAPTRADETKIEQSLTEAITIVPDWVQGETDRAFRYLHNEK